VGTARAQAGIEHRWRIVHAWQAPVGSRSSEAAPAVARHLRELAEAHQAAQPALVVDATGAGDAWVDALVAVGAVPALAVVVAGAGGSVRFGVDFVDGHEVARVVAPRHPGGRGDVPSILGALETATALPPGGDVPAVTVAADVAEAEEGRLLRAQLAGLAWRDGRPDHDDGGHDDLAFALALAVWATAGTPDMVTRARMRVYTAAGQSLASGPRRHWQGGRNPMERPGHLR
jgi:hypothetical protein